MQDSNQLLSNASNVPFRQRVPTVDRVLANLNGFVAVSALVVAAIPIGLTVVFLLVWIVCIVSGLMSGETMNWTPGTSGGDGPGMAGGGVAGGALFLVAVLASAVASLVIVVPFGTWLFLIARWLRRGDSRGRKQLWWCNCIAIGVTTLLWIIAAGVVRDPIAKNVFATPVIIWAVGNLVVLSLSRQRRLSS